MTPIFLPHTLLDSIDDLNAALLPETARQGKNRLCELRDKAIEAGASVLVMVWPSMHWVLLAVEAPADVTITDPAQLIPNLMANPAVLAEALANAKEGQHLVWLHLSRPEPVFH